MWDLVRGFTLLEALIATTLLMLIMGVLATIWQNAYRTANRTRAILRAHQDARKVMDQAERILLERCAALPMAAQNDAASLNWPFQLMSFQSKAHLDSTAMVQSDKTKEDIDSNGDGDVTDPGDVDLNGDGVKNGITGLWSDDAAGMAEDAYAASRTIRTVIIGDNGWKWGAGHTYMWLGGMCRYDSNQAFLDATKSGPSWAYGNANINQTGSIGSLDQNNDEPRHFNNNSWLTIMTRRWTRASETGYGGDALSLTGPYRGVSFAPWAHLDNTGLQRLIPWLAKHFIYRAVSGPGYYREGWRKGAWAVQQTGDYGVFTAPGDKKALQQPYEPDLGFWYSGNSYPTWWNDVTYASGDSARTNPVPRYGDLVQDNGMTWRCEAPALFVYDTTDRGADDKLWGRNMVTSQNGSANANKYLNAQLRNTIAIQYNDPFAFSVAGSSALDRSQAGKVAVSNVSHLIVTTAKTAASVPNAAARGRWGTLTVPGWYNGHTDGRVNPNKDTAYGSSLTAGFPGSAPSAEETATHPAWVSLRFGVVGGFDNSLRETRSRPFDLLFTYALTLR